MADVNDTDLINHLEFVDDREREYFAKAQLGQQVRAFLVSPVGRYLHGRAKLQLQECQQKSLDCNTDSFFGRRKHAKIQKDAGVARAFISWCVDAITEGDMAEREMQEYR